MNRFASLRMGVLSAAAVFALSIAGCAPDISATSVHETLTPLSGPTVRLTVPVSTDLPSGYSTDDLDANTYWRPIGQIPEGTVYTPARSTMTVRVGKHYTCYIVVDSKNNIMRGIYLPDKSAFVTLTPPAGIYFAKD